MPSKRATSSTASIFKIATSSVRSLLMFSVIGHADPGRIVLYHQPEKMAKSKEDLAERQENLEKLKREHGID